MRASISRLLLAWIKIAAVVLAVPVLLLLVFVIAYLPPSTPPIAIPSPLGTAVGVKRYGPIDEAEQVNLSVLATGSLLHRSYSLLSLPNPSGVINGEGVTIGWNGEHHLTVGWPVGARPVSGPDRVGDIDVNYRAYDPDLTHVPTEKTRRLSLRDVSVTFREADTQLGHAHYAATGAPVPEINCIVEISGTDGNVFDRVTAQVIGEGIGPAAAGAHSFGAVGVKIVVTPLPNGESPIQTPTQGEIGEIFPQNDLTNAPSQETWALSYQGFTRNEALQIFSAMGSANFKLMLALNFGEEVLSYDVDAVVSNKIIDDFNACSAKTNIYGRPFSLPRR